MDILNNLGSTVHVEFFDGFKYIRVYGISSKVKEFSQKFKDQIIEYEKDKKKYFRK